MRAGRAGGPLYVLTPQDTAPCWSGLHGREGPRASVSCKSRTGLFLFALSWKKHWVIKPGCKPWKWRLERRTP